MATVYLARDLKHDRDVALKVLHPELGAVIGADRFLAEIKVTARLQHPHILGLIDSGTADGLLFYVMPFVSGESLRARLQREKQLPIADALRIAGEVASALDYAHRQGIIHRDIKPENVLLHDGQALVADFGIALALTSAGGGRMTQTGMSLGTPNYMSPEQAMGEREITARSDVYSLGAMTYEMLTGDPPFTGSTAQAIMAKVMTEKPTPPSTVRDTVPPQVEAAVLSALAKLPADRWGSAREFADALKYEGTGLRTAGGYATRPVKAPAARTALLLGATLVLGLGGLLGWLARRPPPPSEGFPVEFAIEVDSTYTIDADVSSALALSADGSRLAYLGRTGSTRRIYERQLGVTGVRPIAGTEGASDPFYSPDGEWIGFEGADRSIRRVRSAGGNAEVLAKDLGNIYGGSWGSKGQIVVGAGAPQALYLIQTDGGPPERLTLPDTAKGERHGYPSFLPGGEAVLFSSYTRLGATFVTRIGILTLASRKVTWLDAQGLMPHYLTRGELVYALVDGSLMMQPFDHRKHVVRGPARRVVEGVSLALNAVPVFTASPAGVVVYQPGTADETGLVRVNSVGRPELLFRGPALWSPRFSPAGDRIAYARGAADRAPGGRDIWIYSTRDGTNTRLTHGLTAAVDPSWSADGKWIAFSAREEGDVDLWIAPADGTEAPRHLLRRPNAQVQPIFSADGGSIIFLDAGGQGNSDLLRIGVATDARIDTVVATTFDEAAPALSPDGRWLAYQSAETGEVEIYVRAYPGPGARFLVSTGGGREPAWGPRSGELYYRSGSRSIKARLELGAAMAVRERTLLFEAPFIPGRGNRNFDVSPDGTSFLFLESAAQPRLIVRLNALIAEPR